MASSFLLVRWQSAKSLYSSITFGNVYHVKIPPRFLHPFTKNSFPPSLSTSLNASDLRRRTSWPCTQCGRKTPPPPPPIKKKQKKAWQVFFLPSMCPWASRTSQPANQQTSSCLSSHYQNLWLQPQDPHSYQSAYVEPSVFIDFQLLLWARKKKLCDTKCLRDFIYLFIYVFGSRQKRWRMFMSD